MIHELENNEAILLMYLADELPAEDRAEVEQMLSTDAEMRRELEQLRATLNQFESGLKQLDAVEPLAAGRTASIRRVSEAISQWHIDRTVRRSLRPQPAVAGYPWWIYTASAAAVVVVGLLAWWGFMGDSAVPASQHMPGPMAMNFPDEVVGNAMPPDREFPRSPGEGMFNAPRWMMGGRPMRFGEASSDEALDRVERELVLISNDNTDLRGISFFGAPHADTEAPDAHE